MEDFRPYVTELSDNLAQFEVCQHTRMMDDTSNSDTHICDMHCTDEQDRGEQATTIKAQITDYRNRYYLVATSHHTIPYHIIPTAFIYLYSCIHPIVPHHSI
jgi:hypothetical protein